MQSKSKGGATVLKVGDKFFDPHVLAIGGQNIA